MYVNARFDAKKTICGQSHVYFKHKSNQLYYNINQINVVILSSDMQSSLSPEENIVMTLSKTTYSPYQIIDFLQWQFCMYDFSK